MKQAIILWLASAIVAVNPTPSTFAGTPGDSKASHRWDKVAPIPLNQIGTVAGNQYSGDGLFVTAMADGARLRCVFQKLEGKATREGLWLMSTVEGAQVERFRLMAVSVQRTPSPVTEVTRIISPTPFEIEPAKLPCGGQVKVAGQVAQFVRPGLTEEYRVSVDGVEQEFVVRERPEGAGQLRVELDVTGAKAEQLANGARLTLDRSGRKINYNQLRVTDAKGRELTAKLVVMADTHLAVVVDDTAATYPVRIDPTFSDANWISMGGLPGANGTICAAVVDGAGNLYIGGKFTVAGNAIANCVAKWDGSAWSALGSGMSGSYAYDNTIVLALAVSGTDLYAGGDFTTAGGVSASCIAKWDGSAWLALGNGMHGDMFLDPEVSALVVSGTDLYAGGSFLSAGSVATWGIAKWDGNDWWALGDGAPIGVKAMVVSGGNLYVGGYGDSVGGAPATCVVKWDGSTWSGLGLGMTGSEYEGPYVSALVVSGTDLYAGGFFETANGVTAKSVAKWDGNAWSALGEGMVSEYWDTGEVTALGISGTELYAGGYFDTAGGVAAYDIAKWDGSSWSALGEVLDMRGCGGVRALAVLGPNVYVAGEFCREDFVGANIAKWNGSTWLPVGDSMNKSVCALAVSGSDLYAGGHFTIATAAGVKANFIAKWDGSAWSALGEGMDGPVLALAVSGSDLYAGGSFWKAGGVWAYNIARWDGNAWSALGEGIHDYDAGGLEVRALAVSGTNLYVGGSFESAGGVAATNIARWDGSTWSPIGSGAFGWDASGGVHALAVMGSYVYAGGRFMDPAAYLARWDGSAWSAVGSGIGACIADGDVRALAVSGTNLYVGGTFSSAGGVPVYNIAKWNGSTWSALGPGLYGFAVGALAVSGSDLYAGGYAVPESGAHNIAKWNGNTWSPLGSGTDDYVSALAVSGTSLFVGGNFLTAGTKVSPYLARADLVQLVPDITIQPASLTTNLGATANFKVLATGKMPLSYCWRKNETNSLSDGGNISGAGTANLLISNVQFSDEANYSVVVSNAYGIVTSRPPAALVVNDRIPPGLAITSHYDLQSVNTKTITLSGIASDADKGGHGITSVSVNGVRASNDTVSGTGTANWTEAVALTLITKKLSVVATDGRGNSTTNIIHVVWDSVRPTLGISFPAPGQQWGYSSVPIKGWAKDSIQMAKVQCRLGSGAWIAASGTTAWSGNIDGLLPGRTNILSAYAQDAAGNCSLTSAVKVVYNQFLPVNGTYNGLFSVSDVASNRLHESSGFLKLTVSGKGSYSGSFMLAGKTNSLGSGTFSADGYASKTVKISATNSVTAYLNLSLDPGSDTLSGTLSNSAWVAELHADRAVFTTAYKAPFAGKYTLVFPGTTNEDDTMPLGWGWGAVTVNSLGSVVLSGSLADGTVLSQSTSVSTNGWWPLYAGLYGGKGSIWGWLQFTNHPPADLLGGEVSWIKQMQPATTTKYYRLGFTNTLPAQGSGYVAPSNATTHVIAVTNGVVSFVGGYPGVAFENLVLLTNKSVVVDQTKTNKLTMTLGLANGTFTGTVLVPGINKTRTFKGAVLQNEAVGVGYFLGTNLSGRVEFQGR